MADTDLELIMWKLKELIDGDSNPLIRSNPYIRQKMPKIEVLYEEFGKLIGSGMMSMDDEQLLSVYEVDEEYVGKWKKRVVDVAQEAQDMVDMFISSAILKHEEEISAFKYSHGDIESDSIPECFLSIKHVMADIKSLRKEMRRKKWKSRFERLMNNNIIMQNFFKKDTKKSEPQTASPQADETCTSRNPERVKLSATKHEEVVVGFDEDARSIMDRLMEDRKQLDIISVVGMGGLGKTTLATKIFKDLYVEYHFHVRGWITVSQAYTKRDLLIEILKSIGKSDCEAISEAKLCEMLYKSLKGRRYLIVIDDIWSVQAWNDMRKYFPDDETRSRVLITTRLAEISLHAIPANYTHNLRYLTEEESWELLCRKIFRGDECPKSLIGIGERIAKKCQGLPLALVVIAGLLEKGEKSIDLWEKVAESVSSYVVDDPEGCLDTLALSYDHLPRHLKNCFLYVGGFPEDKIIQVWRLIRIWIAEGFIKEAGQKTLEEQAEAYLMDLIDRNLLIVADRRSNGGIKSCHMHDLLRELCLKKATEENFFKKIGLSNDNPHFDSTSSIDKQHRLFTDYKILCEISSHHSATHIRSLLCFFNSQHLGLETGRWVPSFVLLRVLDLLNISRADLRDIQVLIHLRYLAVWSADQTFPFSTASLWNLQTLILKGKFLNSMYSPENIKNMVNLRHLWSERIIRFHSLSAVLFNLQTISRLSLDHGAQNLLGYFPNIKKFGCSVPKTSESHAFPNFSLLTHLEALNLQNHMDKPLTVTKQIRFPETLKRLTLKGCRLPWIYMSSIERLPKLEVLKLLDSSFDGPLWNPGEQQFQQLKFLKLQKLNIQEWEASNFNFPQLKKLVVSTCENLNEIPLEIGDILTLECIEIDGSSRKFVNSVNRFQAEQLAMGNYDLKITVNELERSRMLPVENSFGNIYDSYGVFFDGDPFYN